MEVHRDLSQIDGEYVVKIKDENASLKAYNALVEMLDDEDIEYVEE